MEPVLIVIASPRFDHRLDVGRRLELGDIQALVPQRPIERLNVAVSARRAQRGEAAGIPPHQIFVNF